MAEIVSRAFAIFEDTPTWLETFTGLLSDRGHTVPVIATTRRASLNKITEENMKIHRIFGALVDGDMSQRPMSNEDGVAIVEALLALNLGIRIFSLASIPIPKAEFFIKKSAFYSDDFFKDLQSIGA